MREPGQRTFKTHRCHSRALPARWDACDVACVQCTARWAETKKQSVCLCTLTARSRLPSTCCVRADIDGPRWAFGRLHKVVGALCYERVSGTCLELLSAGKVEFWVIQRLSMSHSLIITLSSIQQVLQTTGRTTLLALSCKYDFIREVSVTSWVINCWGVNKLLGKRV